jgi:hypothetical protein
VHTYKKTTFFFQRTSPLQYLSHVVREYFNVVMVWISSSSSSSSSIYSVGFTRGHKVEFLSNWQSS